MTDTAPKVQCAICGDIFTARIPKGGDGTLWLPWWHGSRTGPGKCEGVYHEAASIDAIRQSETPDLQENER